MPTTETKTLTIGVDGYEYQVGADLASAMSVWGWAKHLGIDEDNETLLYIDVVRTLFEQYNYYFIQDAETFGDDEPRTLRQWNRAYRLRFAAELPIWYRLAMGTAAEQSAIVQKTK